jgi:hypothetical protein
MTIKTAGHTLLLFAKLMVSFSTLVLSELLLALRCTTNCMPGLFLNNGTCSYCPAGRSSKNFGSTSCDVICPAGTYSSSTDLWCKQCPIGKHSGSSSVIQCSSCPLGTYADSTGLSACIVCPTPKFTLAGGATSVEDCQGCQAGYQVSANSTCSACPQGKFSVQGTCASCPQGKYSSDSASTSCNDCPQGKWSNAIEITSSDRCNSCPSNGVQCNSGSSVPFVLAGWFRNLSISPDSVMLCVPQDVCLQAGNGSTECLSGYQGSACSSCEDGYFRLGERCRFCLPASVREIIISGLALLALYLFWRLSSLQDRIPLVVKITFQWLQFLGVFVILSENWPQSLKTLFNITNFFNADIQYFGFTCDKSVTYWTIWIVKVLSPLIVAACLASLTFMRVKLVEKATFERAVLVLKSKLSSIFLTLTLFSTLVFSAIFEIFDCAKQTEGSYVLRVDPSISCFSNTWIVYVSVAALFLLLYALILPGYGLYLIWKFRADKDGLMLRMRSFVTPYRQGCEFWEFVRLFEKILFFFVRDLSSTDRFFRAALMFAVLVTWMAIDVHVVPFKSSKLNKHSFR